MFYFFHPTGLKLLITAKRSLNQHHVRIFVCFHQNAIMLDCIQIIHYRLSYRKNGKTACLLTFKSRSKCFFISNILDQLNICKAARTLLSISEQVIHVLLCLSFQITRKTSFCINGVNPEKETKLKLKKTKRLKLKAKNNKG